MKKFTTFEDEYQLQKNQIYKQWLKFNLSHEMRDDMLQCGKIGLHLAMQTYDPSKGAWSTWMIMYIRKEMMNYINNQMRTVRLPESQINKTHTNHNPDGITSILVTSLDQPINEEEGPITFADALPDKDEPIGFEFDDYNPIKSLLTKYLSQLKPAYQQIISMRYIEEKTFTEIAEELQITKEAVRDKHDRAIKQLQELFGLEQKIHTKNKQINSPRKINKIK